MESQLRWAELDDAEREREYSPSSCLPDGDYAPFIDQYRRSSEVAWSSAQADQRVTTSVIRYGPADSQTIDLAVPDAPTEESPAPIVVFLHGGYWQELSKRDSHFPLPGCVARGWAFAAVDYTLAPDASLDEIVDECRRAVQTLRQRAHSLGVDPDRIVVAGSSAGAHLAAMVALDPGTDTAGLVGVMLVSGIFELEPLLGTSVNEALGLDRPTAARHSPLRADVTGFPPAVVAHGDNETDEFKAQSHSFAQHLRAAGVATSTLEIEGRNHFDVVFDLSEPGTQLGGALARLVEGEGLTDA